MKFGWNAATSGQNAHQQPLLTLDDALRSHVLQTSLKLYCARIHSPELLEFMLRVGKLHSTGAEVQSTRELRQELQAIADVFCTPGGDKEINISASARHSALREVKLGKADAFSLAEQEVFTILKADIWPRFLSSPEYHAALRCGKELRVLGVAGTAATTPRSSATTPQTTPRAAAAAAAQLRRQPSAWIDAGSRIAAAAAALGGSSGGSGKCVGSAQHDDSTPSATPPPRAASLPPPLEPKDYGGAAPRRFYHSIEFSPRRLPTSLRFAAVFDAPTGFEAGLRAPEWASAPLVPVPAKAAGGSAPHATVMMEIVPME